ncbi:glycosyltransferase N-terminal domain-containing protein [Sulfitobacter sp. D35]|uniref:3-deoxy-D-manno-octulosonic acid transferase n=1 Tax=Sulfitobacter sp. D35 TaxID=3083252 RepID=UPI00296F3087|nr:glycosyltransferase N-terminal domain-containing protein [Sulfitobacter sp. D35]MDW4498325.1 glycosyltransferase N-terminal domain-containing protein [Sulfitobacter sp. D35]
MARSLGLAAYRAWSQRGENGRYAGVLARPRGEVVWIHAAEIANLAAVHDLATRLVTARYGLNVLVTLPNVPEAAEKIDTFAGGPILYDMAPKSDHPATVSGFLDHWSPGMGLWAWGGLRPNLVQAAIDRGCPMVLFDADAEGFDGRRDRWIPEVTRHVLAAFRALLVRSSQAEARLEHLGLPAGRLQRLAPLQAGGSALPCDDADEAELSAALSGRPVWLATGVQPSEIATVLSAHRAALRLSHRILLILHLADGGSARACDATVRDEGFRVSHWPDTREPDDLTQVLLVEDAQDLGLFYRVAPVSFLGSSLSPEFSGRDPFEAAALGSAILYGPNIRKYLPLYTRLANAGAARIVNDAHALGIAVTRLMAPDQAASMAHAGWDVISQGAAVTDKLIDLVQTTLDDIESGR